MCTYYGIVSGALVPPVGDDSRKGNVGSLAEPSIVFDGNPSFDDETAEAAEDVGRLGVIEDGTPRDHGLHGEERGI